MLAHRKVIAYAEGLPRRVSELNLGAEKPISVALRGLTVMVTACPKAEHIREFTYPPGYLGKPIDIVIAD